jgi:hypothetical protein
VLNVSLHRDNEVGRQFAESLSEGVDATTFQALAESLELGRSFGNGNHFQTGMISGDLVEFFVESLVVLRGEKLDQGAVGGEEGFDTEESHHLVSAVDWAVVVEEKIYVRRMQ